MTCAYPSNRISVKVIDNEFEALLPVFGNQVSVLAVLDGKPFSSMIAVGKDVLPDTVFAFDRSFERQQKLFVKGRSNQLQVRNAQLLVDQTSLKVTRKLSLTSLRGVDVPAMDLGLTNVTDINSGFRFLPHGEHFNKPATVAIKYDRTKIPDGYTENDIRTFYFDPNTKHWVALERDTVNKNLCMVVSKTTHFTDMINGVIKAPESPETQGYTPTMMNDIKVADPTSGIELIAPPTVNNQGSANLSYTMELPPARNGMSPNLAIQYNSDGGSGWLGEGWDLNIPSISVDTRWGVPRYDPLYETETYNMGGTMLASVVSITDASDSLGSPSVSHRGVLYERNKIQVDPDIPSEKQFYPVVEYGFSTIVRYGTNPGNYYWGVRDSRNGLTYLYGAETRSSSDSKYDRVDANILYGAVNTFQYNTDTKKINENRSDKIIQAEWKLTEVIDLHGTYCRYRYKNVLDTISGDLISKRLMLDEMEVGQKTYNGLNHDTVFYRVKLVSNTPKTKQLNNARYGFLASNQNSLLDSVVIYTDSLRTGETNITNDRVRAYALKYKQSDAFGVDLLEKVIQLDANKNEAATQSFDYYSNFADNTNPDLYNTEPQTYQSLNSLGKGSTVSQGGSLSGGVGGGIPFIVSAEVSYQHTFGSTQSQRDNMIIDINGDGLPDKIYNTVGGLYFSPNRGDGTL